jgi:hypothetical protein
VEIFSDIPVYTLGNLFCFSPELVDRYRCALQELGPWCRRMSSTDACRPGAIKTNNDLSSYRQWREDDQNW